MAAPADPRADYDVFDDPYCYEGTNVLKNIPGLRDPAALEAFETVSLAQRADEPLPEGRSARRITARSTATSFRTFSVGPDASGVDS
jgi:hypothetical protein